MLNKVAEKKWIDTGPANANYFGLNFYDLTSAVV